MNAYLESADEISGASRGTAKIGSLVKWTAYLLPSRTSQQRAERALNTLALSEIDYLTACVIDANRTKPAQGRDILYHAVRGNDISTAEMVATASAVGGLNVDQALANLALVRNAETSSVGAWRFENRWMLNTRVRMWLTQYAWRKAELVRLALLAYRADHGEYPATLEELSPDYITYDDTQLDLLDPWNGLPFGYEPEGFEHTATVDLYAPFVAAGTPVLWGGGTHPENLVESEEQFELDEEGKIVEVSHLHEEEQDELSPGHTLETRTVVGLGGTGIRFFMPLPTDSAEQLEQSERPTFGDPEPREEDDGEEE
ncbi:hypothetical protein Pla123a_08590 [Posidoniimonas polymericola]|uniref:Uncharacterized protein n=1 Tax=Posidoniimonas polymericola TaxID=2528002 RepID=A0A5C5YTG3_9BACT|nr:hypothetical protein [Posidoniimonas polymericola]TWT78070.1 hypothetical protein Pla123a_08590 [Posidoniimonas polymericola]